MRINALLISCILALCLSLGARLARAEQVVFLDFGAVGQAVQKADETVDLGKDEQGRSTVLKLKKGARKGFVPTDLGFANNNDRNAQIGKVVDQVKADFNGMNIKFVTTKPNQGVFTTISIVEGTHPDEELLIDNANWGTVVVAEKKLVLPGGFYVKLGGDLPEVWQVRDPPPDRYLPGRSTEFIKENGKGKHILPDKGEGVAHHIDKGNKDLNKWGWEFVSAIKTLHPNLTPEKRLIELGNNISHELAHLLGLEHNDDAPGGIMKNPTTGEDRAFSDDARKKLKANLEKARKREKKEGDTDQHGTSKPMAYNGDPEHDFGEDMKRFNALQSPHVNTPPFAFNVQSVHATEAEDDPYTDTPLARGTEAVYSLDLGEPGIGETFITAWVELTVMNMADVGGAVPDCELFIDGFEVPDAFDGVDQRITDPELEGFALSDTFTFFLNDFLSRSQIEQIMSEGVLEVRLEVGGVTDYVFVDSVYAMVADGAPPYTIPTLSQWGLRILTLGVLAGLALKFGRRRMVKS